MISTVTTTTVTTVTTVTSIAAANPIETFGLVSAIALIGYLGTKEILGARDGKVSQVNRQLYVGVVPLSIAFAIMAIVKVLSQVRL